MLADQVVMDTPEIHTIQIVHIHCDMMSILVGRAAKEREKERETRDDCLVKVSNGNIYAR